MKAYINIKNDSDLHSHQTLNKRIGLMKGYCISCLYIRLFNHQFIGISALIKSAGKWRTRKRHTKRKCHS